MNNGTDRQPRTTKQIGAKADLILLKIFTSRWYVTLPLDPNGDKVLDERDCQQIVISGVFGANYTEIIKNIDKILLVDPKGIDRRLVIYLAGNLRFGADIDIAKRQVITKELPALN